VTLEVAQCLRKHLLRDSAGASRQLARAILPPYPVQDWLTAQLKAAALAANRADVISLWSGQGAPLLRSLVDETDTQMHT
jgi:hypothetical protein